MFSECKYGVFSAANKISLQKIPEVLVLNQIRTSKPRRDSRNVTHPAQFEESSIPSRSHVTRREVHELLKEPLASTSNPAALSETRSYALRDVEILGILVF